MKRRIITLLFLIFITVLNLFPKTKKSTENFQKIKSRIDFFWNTSHDSLIFTIENAIKRYKKLKDKKSLAKLYQIYGNFYYDTNNYEKAQFYYTKAIELYKEIELTQSLWYLYNALGNTYSLRGELTKAIKNYLKALSYCNNKKNFAVIQNNISKVYISLGDYKQALKFLQEAEKNCGINQWKTQQTIYTNLGIVYHNLGKNDLAKKYYLKSLEINKQKNNIDGMCENYNNLGNLFSELKKFDIALKYYKKAISIGKKMNIIYPFINIANLYTDKKQYKKALYYLKLALPLSKNNPEIKKTIFVNLSELYKKLGNYQKALKFYTKYSQLADSLSKINDKSIIDNLRLKYENAKKEKKLQYYKTLYYKQKLIKTYLFSGILFLIFTIIFIIFHYKKIKIININLSNEIKKNKKIQNELSKAKRNLEEKVKLRTKELYKKNVELSKQIRENEKSFEILKKYAFLVNNARDLLILIDNKLEIELINQNTEMVGKKFEKLWNKEIYEKVIKHNIEKALSGKEIHFQGNFKIANNKESFYDIAVYPYIENKKVVYLVVSARDISEYKKVEQQLAQSEKIAALGEMAAEMAHEIKNPITIMKSTSELLKANYHKYNESKIKAMLDIFIETAQRINDILNKLRDFVIEENFKFEKKNLVKIIKDVLAFTMEECKSKKIQIKFEYSNPEILLNVDESEIYKVFLNLIINSINAVSSYGKINLNLFKNNDKVIFQIEDNGKGIKKENLPKIFDPFYSTDKKGMGLGLGIVYRILKKHKAQISVDSKINKGTIFTIIFPGDIK